MLQGPQAAHEWEVGLWSRVFAEQLPEQETCLHASCPRGIQALGKAGALRTALVIKRRKESGLDGGSPVHPRLVTWSTSPFYSSLGSFPPCPHARLKIIVKDRLRSPVCVGKASRCMVHRSGAFSHADGATPICSTTAPRAGQCKAGCRVVAAYRFPCNLLTGARGV